MSISPPKKMAPVEIEENEKSFKAASKSSSSDNNKTISSSLNETHVLSNPTLKTQKLDRFLQLYCKWTSSSLLTERGLKMFQWTMWLLSQITKDKYKVLSPSLRKLYSDLSMMRYVLRLYGLPLAVEGFRTGSWSGGSWKDERIHKLGKFAALSMIVYHPLEMVAWAQWTMPKLIPTSRVDGNRVSAWSCRFWVAFIAADLYGSILKKQELENNMKLISGEASGGTTAERRAIEKSISMNKLQILRNVFFTGPCLTWSMNEWATNPLLRENWCNGLCFAEAVTCMYQSIFSIRD